ncbi:carbamoyl-phosphate synthase large subunit [Arcicella aurantiaca]|uniref:Carbamoyl-phosphate synthase large subunit n=1 Tax=Arcicella aurantiaca TaxID=591202 RepID=A0A316E7X9_9BACT|nr:ATP-grasp domain-containing protein [Arcicella aurantiaca]PWK26176.1 carbamoyl-phosphate synthase large subunit [Arcicella aurantiaca]
MPDNQLNILFLGGAKRVSLAERLISAGKSLGKEVKIFSYELDKYVPIAGVGEVIIGLKWKDEQIYTHLTEIVNQYQIHIILPFVDPATLTASVLKEKLPNVFIPVSSIETCDIFFDKAKANQWFLGENFPVPHQDLSKFPLIAKPIKGSASQGIEKIENEAELTQFLASHQAEDYLIQGFIEGDEYTVDCYVDIEGEIMSIVPRKRLETISGEVSKSITEKDDLLIEFSAQILKKANFLGAITIQFLKDSTDAYIMEINPRLGGGVITSIEAGADIPLMILKDYLNIKNTKVTNWTNNLLMMRANREFFIQT